MKSAQWDNEINDSENPKKIKSDWLNQVWSDQVRQRKFWQTKNSVYQLRSHQNALKTPKILKSLGSGESSPVKPVRSSQFRWDGENPEIRA